MAVATGPPDNVFILLLVMSSCRVLTMPLPDTKHPTTSDNQDFGEFFAKIPQSVNADSPLKRELIARAFFPHFSEYCQGCTNQVAKILYPLKSVDEADKWSTGNYINVPVLKQPFDKYKILVVTAPKNMELNKEEPVVIYVILPDIDDISRVPKVYFVNTKNGKVENMNVNKAEPIIIIDSNRTVTGIKSKEISKYIKFKNKFTIRHVHKPKDN